MAKKKKNKYPLYDDWFDKYKPLHNHIDVNASFGDDEGGCMFETFGKEYDFVVEQAKLNDKKVWTIIDGDDGEQYVIAGWHYVNRFGYFVTELEWEKDDECYIID